MSTQSKNHPNLIFIFADQLGAKYMGCYGHPQVQTPELDCLASQSLCFENTYTAAPLCTPFRGALFTGRYPSISGIAHNWQQLPIDKPILPKRFNEAGYDTVYIGKWHLTEEHNEIYVAPEKRGGFKDFVGWDSGHVQHIDQQYFDNTEEILTMQGHETDALTHIACNRLDQYAQKDKPFSMFISYQSPHPYCDPPEAYHNLYREKPLAYSPTVDHNAIFNGYGKNNEPQDLKNWTERYFGEITHLDAAVGRLLQHIKNLGLFENSVIVFTSDHGDMGGSHGLFEKSYSYEEASRIPLFIHTPFSREPARCKELFSSIDFYPTLLGLCNIDCPEPVCGQDHSNWLRGKDNTWKRKYTIMQLEDWGCIFDGKHKLTMNQSGDEVRSFFQLSTDPYEQHNLFDEPFAQNDIKQLQQEYLRQIGS